MSNKTPEEMRIQKEQEARDREKDREEAAEERRLDDEDDANTTGSASGNVEADTASGGAPEPA